MKSDSPTLPTITIPTIYARLEPTDDGATFDMFRATGRDPKTVPYKDVVLYASPAATHPIARIPWYYDSKPTRRNKWQMLNCYRYRLQWIEEASA